MPHKGFLKDTIKAEVEKIVLAGIDYIQLLDQNHGGTSYFITAENIIICRCREATLDALSVIFIEK